MRDTFKFVKQQDIMDCGVACIQMILKHYDSDMPAHKLRHMTGTDIDGTSALGLKSALEELQFECLAVQADNSVWTDPDMNYPAIAHVLLEDNRQHYIIIYGFKNNKLLIADPAEGKYKMSPEEFTTIWTNILLIPKPNKQYQPVVEKIGGLTSFLPALFKSKKIMFFTIIASFLATSLSIVSSYYFQGIIDRVIPQEDLSLLNIMSIGLLGVYLLRVLFDYIRSQLLIILGQSMSSHIMLDYFKHVLYLPMQFFNTRKNGDIISRFLDANKIIRALASSALALFLDITMVAIVGTFLFIQNRILFVITLLSLPIYFVTVLFFVKRYNKANEEEMSSSAILNSSIIESLDGMETIKSYNSEQNVYETVQNQFLNLMKKSYKTVTLDNMQRSIKQSVQLLTSAGVLWAGSYYILHNSMSIGQLITYNALLVFFTNPLENIINLQAELQTAEIASKRMNEVLAIESEYNLTDKQAAITFDGGIRINHLTFSYNLKESTLKNITCHIPFNQTVALVGMSGSGKSTLAKLLLRLHEVAEGTIQYDNILINKIPHNYLRDHVTYLPQESFFFKGTIIENLLFGLSHQPSELEIITACERAKVRHVIDSLPLGFNTPLEEGAANLSGGQKQRLAIARALLRDTNIYIFDEATSSVDTVTEQKIIQSISELKNKLIIHITHHLPIAKQCDQILVMHDGQLVEEGTHEQLLANSGTYHTLWNSTFP